MIKGTHVQRVVEPQVLVECKDILDLLVGEVEPSDVEVLCKTALVVALRDDSDVALCGPSQQHLGGGLAMLLSNRCDGGMLE